jgi:hypothetical protein
VSKYLELCWYAQRNKLKLGLVLVDRVTNERARSTPCDKGHAIALHISGETGLMFRTDASIVDAQCNSTFVLDSLASEMLHVLHEAEEAA